MSGITIPTLDEISGHTVMSKLRSLCKRFISLAKEVDEKIDAPLEEAHQAVQTANTASANANQSVESANQAIQTANTASANANAASESAETAATTVAGYNTRLTTAEGEIDTLQSDLDGYDARLTSTENTISAHSSVIQVIGGRVTNVEGRMTTAEGEIDTLQSDLDTLEQAAVLTTGNQPISGIKTYNERANNGIMDFIGSTLDVATRAVSKAFDNHIYTYLITSNRSNSVHIDRVFYSGSAITVERTMLKGSYSNLHNYSVRINPDTNINYICIGAPYHNAQSIILLSHSDYYGVTTYEPINGSVSDTWEIVVEE